MIYISKQIDPNYYPEMDEGIPIAELLQALNENGYPDLTLGQLEEQLFDLEKQGLVDLEVQEDVI